MQLGEHSRNLAHCVSRELLCTFVLLRRIFILRPLRTLSITTFLPGFFLFLLQEGRCTCMVIHWSPRACQVKVARYRKSWVRIGGVHVFLCLGRVTLVKIKLVGCWSNRKRSLGAKQCPNCKTIEQPHLRSIITNLNGLPRTQAT